MAWASQVVLEVKNPFANAGDIREVGSIAELGRSTGGRCGNLANRGEAGETFRIIGRECKEVRGANKK